MVQGDTFKIHPRSKSTRSKSTQSKLRTAYQSRVRVRGNSDSEKKIKNKQNIFLNKFIKRKTINFIGWILNADGF